MTLVEINPMSLKAGQTDVFVKATVIDDVGVRVVTVSAHDTSKSKEIGLTALTLVTGSPMNGTYQGTIVIPPEISDGEYQIILAALVAEDKLVSNNVATLSVKRGVTGNSDGDDDTTAKEKSCCKVTINVSAGPVNIYICGSDTKTQTEIR